MQLRAFIADDQSGTTWGGRAPIAWGHRVAGLPCGREYAMRARWVVKFIQARRGAATASLRRKGMNSLPWRREALEAAVQADRGLRVAAAGFEGKLDDGEERCRDGLCYLRDQNTLGVAGQLDDAPREDLQQRFLTFLSTCSRGWLRPMPSLSPTCLTSSIQPWEGIAKPNNRRRRTHSRG